VLAQCEVTTATYGVSEQRPTSFKKVALPYSDDLMLAKKRVLANAIAEGAKALTKKYSATLSLDINSLTRMRLINNGLE
jgi:hypothetical protein